jgi:hypothetical protein
MRRFVVIAGPVVVMLLSACDSSGGDEPVGSSDCTQQIRFGKATYSSYSSTRREGNVSGDALLADCNDLRSTLRKPNFLKDSSVVEVVAFAGFQMSDVVGIQLATGPTAVFVNDSLPDDARDDIVQALE